MVGKCFHLVVILHYEGIGMRRKPEKISDGWSCEQVSKRVSRDEI